MNQTRIKVSTVEKVKLEIASVTGRVTISAEGKVNSGGWTNPALADTPNPPEDGNRHFDFVAHPPTGPSTDVISPLEARRTVQAGAGRFCVVIHAAGNEGGPECIAVTIGDEAGDAGDEIGNPT